MYLQKAKIDLSKRSIEKISDGLNYVQCSMSVRSNQEKGCLNAITKRWRRLSLFDIRRSDFRNCLMSNLVNPVMDPSRFNGHWIEAKNRLSEVNHQNMNTFESVWCSKNNVWVHSMFDEMVFNPSLRKI